MNFHFPILPMLVHDESRTVDVHIRRLRKAINNDVKEDYIRTVRSAGYSFGS